MPCLPFIYFPVPLLHFIFILPSSLSSYPSSSAMSSLSIADVWAYAALAAFPTPSMSCPADVASFPDFRPLAAVRQVGWAGYSGSDPWTTWVWTVQIHLIPLNTRSFSVNAIPYCKCISLPYDFRNSIFFPLASFIVIQSIIHLIYKLPINQ